MIPAFRIYKQHLFRTILSCPAENPFPMDGVFSSISNETTEFCSFAILKKDEELEADNHPYSLL
jgi:hypothetical protein